MNGSRRGRWRSRVLAAGVVGLVVLAMLVTDAPMAGASSDGGASSRVVGRGDIVTSILGWRRGSPRSSTSSPAPRCYWLTMSDIQIEWLAAVSASSVRQGNANPVLDAVREHLSGDQLPDGDLQARVCGGIAVRLRYVPRETPLDPVEMLHRRMITRLPVPDPVWSPPEQAVVPVRQPVFLSIRADDWSPIENTISVDGITATVRARPLGLRVINGDPALQITKCAGPGRPFDPASSLTAARQAAHPQACTHSYVTPTEGLRDPARQSWIGTVTVLWEAEWRAEGDGSGDDAWLPLGVIPRTRLFDRSVREVATSIESLAR